MPKHPSSGAKQEYRMISAPNSLKKLVLQFASVAIPIQTLEYPMTGNHENIVDKGLQRLQEYKWISEPSNMKKPLFRFDSIRIPIRMSRFQATCNAQSSLCKGSARNREYKWTRGMCQTKTIAVQVVSASTLIQSSHSSRQSERNQS
jgi:hypothetical protein